MYIKKLIVLFFVFFVQYTIGRTSGLIDAVKSGDLASVKELVLQGADINAKDANNNSALKWAIVNWQEDIIKFLLGAGAHIPDIRLRIPFSANFLEAVTHDSHPEKTLALLKLLYEGIEEIENNTTELNKLTPELQQIVIKRLINTGKIKLIKEIYNWILYNLNTKYKQKEFFDQLVINSLIKLYQNYSENYYVLNYLRKLLIKSLDYTNSEQYSKIVKLLDLSEFPDKGRFTDVVVVTQNPDI